ncbi:MAG: polysaccharide biosynthesis/export family protein [Phycisphaerales bacterium]
MSLLAAAVSVGLAGCSNKVLDPTQIGRFRPTPAVDVILDSLGVAEEPTVAWETAEEPRPEDIRSEKGDYILQPGDIVRISIFELLQEGVALINDYTITESGKVSIPEVGNIQAAGLTESRLEEEIRKALTPNILRSPSVTAMLISSQQRAYSILGNAVPEPGRYPIPRYDYRLTDALATAQTQMQYNVSYVYVSRREGAGGERPARKQTTPGRVPELEMIQPGSSGDQSLPTISGDSPTSKRDIPEPSEPAQKFESEREMLDLISPQAAAWPRSDKVMGAPTGAPQPNGEVTASMLPGGFRVLVPMPSQGARRTAPEGIVQSPAEFGPGFFATAQVSGSDSKAAPRMEWIYDGTQWKQVPAKNGAAPAVQPPARQTPVQPQAQTPAPQTQTQTGPQSEWVLRNGQWVQVPRGQSQPQTQSQPQSRPQPQAPPLSSKPPVVATPGSPAIPRVNTTLPNDLDWEAASQTRLIRIPADKLLAGDARYNIVIKPGDTIHVPVDLIGEFFIMGNVNKTGVINLTGRPMTLMMAIAAAGGLGPLAMPRRVEVTRRIGTKQQEVVMVDLDKIAKGEQPDFFIKPNDLINVGTDGTARWRAVLRNAFRATYGFGFVYDRNFADADYGTGFPNWF